MTDKKYESADVFTEVESYFGISKPHFHCHYVILNALDVGIKVECKGVDGGGRSELNVRRHFLSGVGAVGMHVDATFLLAGLWMQSYALNFGR